MSNPFTNVAKQADTLKKVMANRIKTIEEVSVHLTNIHIYALAIGSFGLSSDKRHSIKQVELLQSALTGLQDAMYNLSIIHELESEVGMKTATLLVALSNHIDIKGFPRNKEEAQNL